MLVGAAVLPAAPVLAPGVGRGLGPELRALAEACEQALDRLPPADVAVVVAAGERGVHDRAVVDLTSLGRPDVVDVHDVHRHAIAAMARKTGLPQIVTTPLPLELSTLTLQVARRWPVAPVAVSPAAAWEVHVATGAAVVEAVSEVGVRAVLIAAGDGSASLSPKAPRPGRPGAQEWQDELVACIAEHGTGRLDRLGPERALAVAARGWPALAVLHGATARGRIGLVLRRAAAPRGVGYVVALGC